MAESAQKLGLVPDDVASDDLLAQAAASAGDRAAYGQLVARHHARVLGLLRHLTRNQALADDLAQQTFLRGWEKLSSFAGDSSARFAAWLSSIAYREFLQRTRRGQLEQRLFVSDIDTDSIPAESAEGNPSDLGFSELLSACNREQAEVLYMNFVLELTHDEIAQITDRPLGTVKSHIARGKAAIKARLSSREQSSEALSAKTRGAKHGAR